MSRVRPPALRNGLDGTRSCVMCHNLAHETAQLDRYPLLDPGRLP